MSRIGFASLKGTRHVDRPSVELSLEGPVGDRVFCLVDPARSRVVRTVENPTLMRTVARWDGRVLAADLPAGSVRGAPAPTGETLEVDYWGRTVALEVLGGPWRAAYSEYLGYPVELARGSKAGDVVYGGSVSLVTSSSLDCVAERLGAAVDSAQLRATFTVQTDGEPPHVEDSWVGRRVRVGEAEVEVRSALPRCAVVDLDPATGHRRADVLRTLAGYRRAQGEVLFGVDAVVTTPGRVAVGAVVERS
ncbi:MAG: uncharacterized protein QOF53_3177 [Nocardioidaceae bacterium]|nr:uncharacterized protein [Nocardioidaceae bacterium]